MFVFYNEDLSVDHVVFEAPADYAENMRARGFTNFIEHPEALSIADFDLAPDLKVRKREQMAPVAPATATLGETVTISGIPEGASIEFDGALAGVMDKSKKIEFQGRSIGPHTFVFRKPGFFDKELTVEIVA